MVETSKIAVLPEKRETSLTLMWLAYQRTKELGAESSLKISTGLLSPYWLPNYVSSAVVESEGAGVVVGLLTARYYDNTRGQFLSQDPSFLDIGRAGFEQNYGRTLRQHLANPQALNSYSWALNNPIIYKDPDGEIVPLLVLGALAFYGGYSAGTDLYEGYTSGDSGQFGWGVVGAATSLIPGGGAAKGAGALADDAARAGFKSFEAFKRAMGPAGEGKEWHHLVEQTINKGKFSEETLHNTKNVVNIATDLHRKISGFYSSKLDFTGGQTVRQWVSSKSFQQQLDFAKKQLQGIQKQLDKIKSSQSNK